VSNNSAKLATLVTTGQPAVGKIQRVFRVTCGICENWISKDADSFEGFCKLLEGEFHLSTTHGWVHNTCQKRVPMFLSLTRKPTTQAQ
jgi:hypothetical protein